MVTVLTLDDEFQELKTRLVAEIKGLENEINRQRLPSYHIIERKIQLINSTLDTIESNPNLTMQELSDLIEYRIDGEERELDDAETVPETERILNEIRILEWIRFIVRKVGQLMLM